MYGHSACSNRRIAPSLQEHRKALASSETHTATLMLVAILSLPGRFSTFLYHGHPPAGFSRGCKTNRMTKQGGKSLRGSCMETKIS